MGNLIRLIGLFQRVRYSLLRFFTRRKYVVLGNRQVGIGNRMMMLANTYCNFGKKNISLLWGLDGWVPEPFENLFMMTDAPGFQVKSCPINVFSRTLFYPYPKDHRNGWVLYSPPELAQSLKRGRLFCLYNDTPEWARKKYAPFFCQLKPVPAVMNRIRNCPLPEDAVCVQARNSHGAADLADVASLDALVACMHTYSCRQTFFISCMEKDVSELLHERFPGQIIELPNKNYRSMTDAVADMYLLGSRAQMICTRGSTFAEAAWWLGGCHASVMALASDYRQKSVSK